MAMAVISVYFGALSFLLPIPVVVPAIGLALGANSYLKERKKDDQTRQKRVLNTATAGMVVCGIVVAMVIIHRMVS